MLNKKICIKCINKHRTACGWNEKEVDKDDYLWKRDLVCCPVDFIIFPVYLNPPAFLSTATIPYFCKYKLEHILSNSENA
jgi:hypothetical protein